MSLILNRRGFLQSLIALGASYSLPGNASEARVQEVWQEALQAPWLFRVDEFGTITDPGFQEAQVWAGVFDDIWPYGLRSPQDVIRTVERCEPLTLHFRGLAAQELDLLRGRSPETLDRGQLQLAAALEDLNHGWYDWVLLGGQAAVERFRAIISDWLQEPVDWTLSEWFPLGYGAMGQAKALFESLDWDMLEALGVAIVEGDHPGSTYFAAELTQSIEEANEAAALLELPFRFGDVV